MSHEDDVLTDEEFQILSDALSMWASNMAMHHSLDRQAESLRKRLAPGQEPDEAAVEATFRNGLEGARSARTQFVMKKVLIQAKIVKMMQSQAVTGLFQGGANAAAPTRTNG